MHATLKSIKIAGMQAAVPRHRHSYVETPDIFSQEEANKIARTTGIHSRRILPNHLCASDMCIKAAEGLLKDLDWEPGSVDVLIFVSQDADYALPATACLMQNRLGLPQTAACMDIPLGCSGFVYATWIAGQMLQNSSGKRALILCGDTSSRHLMEDDRGTLPLFGDAGVATALEYDESWPDSYAVFGTDGSGGQHISVKAGGRRNPTIPGHDALSDTERVQLYKDSRLHLNGAAVFTFTLKVVPKLIRETLEYANLEIDDIDMFVMHQANKFILDHLRKKAGIDPDKYLVDMEQFGNTSSASVPLAICHQLSETLSQGTHKVMLGGFGVGWSWGAIVTDMGPVGALKVIEIEDDFSTLTLEQAQQVEPA